MNPGRSFLGSCRARRVAIPAAIVVATAVLIWLSPLAGGLFMLAIAIAWGLRISETANQEAGSMLELVEAQRKTRPYLAARDSEPITEPYERVDTVVVDPPGGAA